MAKQSYKTDILIVGASTGGVAGTLAALKLGKRVILTEATDWIGGQLTSQAVPPDEHPWIEKMGATASYRQFRNHVRAYYKRYYPLKKQCHYDECFNPGNGFVSRLCHEPKVALAVLEGMLAPYLSTGQLELFLNLTPVAAHTEAERVLAVTFQHEDTGETVTAEAPYILDATDLGDMLELANIDHVIGAESQVDTNELHAPIKADPLDQQALSWCFALDYKEGENHTTERPDGYEVWCDFQAPFWPDKQFSWFDVNPVTLKRRHLGLFESELESKEGLERTLWTYRRALAKDQLEGYTVPSDISLVNWPQTDYFLGPIVGVSNAEKQKNLEACKNLSLSFLHWMQTEAPRHDGGVGYSELRLRKDVVGTEDGLAKMVYVRESRRIKSVFTVLEEHIGVEQRKKQNSAEQFFDSVGIGSYRIDLHPSSTGRNYVDISSYPFQIPLGALLPVRIDNLLPACKNIGVTHITNGCYRLHPVEWNIGEVAGALAAYCLEKKVKPKQVRETHLVAFQTLLERTFGIELEWPKEIRQQSL